MMHKQIKIPGAAHAITIAPSPNAVVVTVAGKVVAYSTDALVLTETSYPPVFYIPRKDVDMALLQRSDHVTYCPYKGDCVHYSIPAGGRRSLNAAWTYEAPYGAVAAIKDHLAFYPDRVDSIVEWFADCPSPLPGHDFAPGPVRHAARHQGIG